MKYVLNAFNYSGKFLMDIVSASLEHSKNYVFNSSNVYLSSNQTCVSPTSLNKTLTNCVAFFSCNHELTPLFAVDRTLQTSKLFCFNSTKPRDLTWLVIVGFSLSILAFASWCLVKQKYCKCKSESSTSDLNSIASADISDSPALPEAPSSSFVKLQS